MWRKVIVIGLVVGLGWTASSKDAKHNLLQWNEVQKIVASQNARPLRPIANRPQSNPNWINPADQIAFWDFETGAQGWTAVDGNGDGTTWTVGTTSDLSIYTPPSYGTQYAFYSDDDAGSGAGAGDEWWISPDTGITGVSSLYLNFSWGFNIIDPVNETLFVNVSFDGGTTWNTVWSHYGADGNGTESINLSSYLPQSTIVIAFRYVDADGGWYWACAGDNVELTTGAAPQPDESGDSLLTPSQTIQAGTPFDVALWFSNQGNVDDTFNIYLDVYDMYGNLIASYSSGPHINPVGGAIADTFTVAGLSKGFYWLVGYHDRAGDVNTTNDTMYWHALVLNNPGNQVLLMDLDPALYNPSVTGGGLGGQSGVWTAWAMDDLGYMVDWQWMTISDPSNYNVAWINHGVYGYLALLPSAFVTLMQGYLYGGGKAYCEGGDIWGWSGVWGYDPAVQAAWDSLFGIDASTTDDGSSDLNTMVGVPNASMPWVYGHTWQNNGENAWMDRLGLFPTPELWYTDTLFRNPDVGYYAGIAYSFPLGPGMRYHTVATDFELAFMQRTTMDVWDYLLLEKVLKTGLHENPTAVAENTPSYPYATLKVNGSKLVFTLPKNLNVNLRLYDKTGRMVRTLASGTYGAGTHTISLANINVPAGIYIARLVAGDRTYTTPVMILNYLR